MLTSEYLKRLTGALGCHAFLPSGTGLGYLYSSALRQTLLSQVISGLSARAIPLCQMFSRDDYEHTIGDIDCAVRTQAEWSRQQL